MVLIANTNDKKLQTIIPIMANIIPSMPPSPGMLPFWPDMMNALRIPTNAPTTGPSANIPIAFKNLIIRLLSIMPVVETATTPVKSMSYV